GENPGELSIRAGEELALSSRSPGNGGGVGVHATSDPRELNHGRLGGHHGDDDDDDDDDDEEEDDWDDDEWDDDEADDVARLRRPAPRPSVLRILGLLLHAPGTLRPLSLGLRGRSGLHRRHYPPALPPALPPAAAARRPGTVGKSFNRFSTFVKSGGEAFVLGQACAPVSAGERPKRETKFKGMKSFTSYRLSPSWSGAAAVGRRYKHFDWLHARLLHKYPVISVPQLPEKQATGRFEGGSSRNGSEA
ncbi:unnamed protein product, partial [Lampetra planeri]